MRKVLPVAESADKYQNQSNRIQSNNAYKGDHMLAAVECNIFEPVVSIHNVQEQHNAKQCPKDKENGSKRTKTCTAKVQSFTLFPCFLDAFCFSPFCGK